MRLLLRGGWLADPRAGLDGPGDVLVEDGIISAVGGSLEANGAKELNCAGKTVLPGLVDAHVHLREPGREDEETIASGTRAAVHGGFTAVCTMPNTQPVADTGAAIRFLVERAEEHGVARVFPIGAMTSGQKGSALAEMGDMVAEGAVAFSDDGSGVQDAGMMRRVMDYAKMFEVPVISHCEDASLAGAGVVNEGVVSTRLGLPGWPSAAEEIMVARDIRLAELTGCRLHLAHLSTAGSVALVREAKASGAPVTCEVTPHHLFLDEDAIDDRYNTALKMNPPLRTEADRRALIAGLTDGTVDCIASDHAPHAAHEKEMEFEIAPFGTTGLETTLSLVCTHLVSAGVVGWGDVVRLLCHGPRLALGLPAAGLSEGLPADLTVVDPEEAVTVARGFFESRSSNSAFVGEKLKGRASEVLVNGSLVLAGGEVLA